MFKFSDYDLFAYVATGLAALASWDAVFQTHIVLAADWTVSTATSTLALSYVIGQVIASPSAFLLEKQFVQKVIGPPPLVLFGAADPALPAIFRRTILREYYVPLEEGVRQRVVATAQAEGKPTQPGEPLFWAAFRAARSNPAAYARMESFLKLYGFCRNTAFVALAAALTLAGLWLYGLVSGCSRAPEHTLQWSGFALALGLGMLLRYLKFLRLYSVEVFITYSEGAGNSMGRAE